MANVVGEVQVVVVPDGSHFGVQLQQILDRASGQAASAGAQMGNAFTNAARGANDLGNTIDQRIGGGFADAAVKAAAFTGAIWATKAAVEGVVNKLSGLFDQVTQARLGFNAILGDKAGNNLLAQIQEFARVSPFVTQELVNYSQQLLGVGMASEKIVPLLKDTGNVIASVGGDTANLSRVLFTLTQIQTVGRLTGQDAMQLQSALIPITKMLAEYMGKTIPEVKKLQEQGKISAEQVMAAISMAGQKVPHAMDNAVKTISGAKAVLSDTVKLMLQNSPALRKIYDDLVIGIQNFAAKLGDPKVVGAIEHALASVGKVYDAVRPAIMTFISTMGSASFTGLSTFTTIMESLATVLDTLAKSGALDIVAKALAAYATLKAPMMLMQYAQQFMNIGKALGLGGGLGLIERLLGVAKATDATAKAARGAVAAEEALAAAVTAEATAEERAAAVRASRVKMGFSIAGVGLMMAGQQLGQSSDPKWQGLGTMAQYTGMGAMVGGPVGAVVGGVVGTFMAINNAVKEQEKMLRDAMAKAGKDAGIAFIKGVTDGMASGDITSGQAWRQLEDKRKSLTDLMSGSGSQYDRLYQRYLSEEQAGGTTYTRSGAITPEKRAKERADQTLKDIKTQYGPMVADITAQQDQLFGTIDKKIETVYSKLPEAVQKKIESAFKNPMTSEGAMRNALGNGPLPGSFKDLDQLEISLKKYGLTLDDVTNMSEADLTRIIRNWEGLDTAQQKAITSAQTYVDAFDKAKSDAEVRWGALSKEQGDILSVLSAEKTATEATAKAYNNKTDAAAQASAKQAQYQYAIAAGAQEYARVLKELQNTGLTTTEMETKATEAQLKAEAAAIKGVQVAASGTIDTLAKKYGYTKQQLWDVLQLQGAIDPKLNIVVSADVQQALIALITLRDQLAKLKNSNSGLGSDQNYYATQEASLQKQINDALATIGAAGVVTSGGGTKPGGGGGGSSGPSLADLMKQAAESLSSSIKSAMDSAKQAADAWKAGIKEHVQYERAVSTSRALANTNKQIADIKFLDTGIATLKARGLSEAAIAALDINSITDVRQVRKLLSSDPASLKKLSEAVAARDKAAADLSFDREQEKMKKTITDSIIAAAKILGMDMTQAQAQKISAQFTIVSSTDVDKVVAAVLKKLSGSKVK